MAKSSEPRYRRQATDARIDWDAALREHGPWLRTVIGARLMEPQAVEDVFQEVAMAAVQSQAKSSVAKVPPDKVGAWLYQVAVRQTLMYRRRAGRQRNLVDRFADRQNPIEEDSREPDPLDWMMASERAGQIKASLQELHKRDREILLLKYEHNWSYRDIATHLGISHSAVEARLHRARKRLRQQLAERHVIR